MVVQRKPEMYSKARYSKVRQGKFSCSNSLLLPHYSRDSVDFINRKHLLRAYSLMCLGLCSKRQITLLALFDVSAAFDTVDHSIPLQRFWYLGTPDQLDPLLHLRPPSGWCTRAYAFSLVPVGLQRTFQSPAGICLSLASLYSFTADLSRILSEKWDYLSSIC